MDRILKSVVFPPPFGPSSPKISPRATESETLPAPKSVFQVGGAGAVGTGSLRGVTIREGQNACLFYASANRDEAVYPDGFEFKIDRHPNPHLGFGTGEHFCLGSHLARRSQRALFAELSRRLEHVELTGEPQWIKSSFVVGFKHLPIRYRIARGV